MSLGDDARRLTRSARAVQHFEQATRADLHERRWLRLHVLLLAGLCTALCWGVSVALRAAGVDSLLWRPVLALALTWPLYLGLLWAWGRWLISRDEGDGLGDALDLADAGLDLGSAVVDGAQVATRAVGRAVTQSAAQTTRQTAADWTSDALSGAAEVVGEVDEAAAAVVPLAVVVGVALALVAALSCVVFGLFGVEILLGVAVEIAFASFGGALAWRARREGWLGHALRRTAWPMAGLLAAVAATGWAFQTWLPAAVTWPQALRMLFA